MVFSFMSWLGSTRALERNFFFVLLFQHFQGNSENTDTDWSNSVFSGCCFSSMSCYKDLSHRTILPQVAHRKQRE